MEEDSGCCEEEAPDLLALEEELLQPRPPRRRGAAPAALAGLRAVFVVDLGQEEAAEHDPGEVEGALPRPPLAELRGTGSSSSSGIGKR